MLIADYLSVKNWFKGIFLKGDFSKVMALRTWLLHKEGQEFYTDRVLKLEKNRKTAPFLLVSFYWQKMKS